MKSFLYLSPHCHDSKIHNYYEGQDYYESNVD